jgi:hypothetical protein
VPALTDGDIWAFLHSLDLPLADEVVTTIAQEWSASLSHMESLAYGVGYDNGIRDCLPEPHPGT